MMDLFFTQDFGSRSKSKSKSRVFTTEITEKTWRVQNLKYILTAEYAEDAEET